MKIKNINSNFFRIFFSIILTFAILTVSFFLSDINSIFADDNLKISICIDPGHGGKDFGASGPTGLREKDVNLDIAIRLKDKLINAGFNVMLTREDDTSKSLDEIVDFANTNNADIFISIHNNSHISRDKNGTETFYCSQSPYGNFLASYINVKTVEQIGTINRGVKAANFREIKNTKMVSALIEGAFISNPDEEAKLNDPGFRDKIATGIYNGIIE
jgi:N-acetylmuramoyl-L-alanine amidase